MCTNLVFKITDELHIHHTHPFPQTSRIIRHCLSLFLYLYLHWGHFKNRASEGVFTCGTPALSALLPDRKKAKKYTDNAFVLYTIRVYATFLRWKSMRAAFIQVSLSLDSPLLRIAIKTGLCCRPFCGTGYIISPQHRLLVNWSHIRVV